MDLITSFKEKVRQREFTVVLPEGDDERIIGAAGTIADEKIARPILLGDVDKIRTIAESKGVDLVDIEVINPKKSERLDYYAEQYVNQRKDVSVKVAKRIIARNLFHAGMMLRCGDADALVGGAASATATVIQAGMLTVGLMEGFKIPSSYFLMVLPEFLGEKDKKFIFADCAVNIDPTAEELADIALASAQSAAGLLDDKPRVAMLSFSTKGSASSPSTEKVIKALEIARQRRPQLAIDGEFQADTAIVPRVAAKKVKGQSEVAGKANVLIFPDLDAANMAYKLTQYTANAAAIGPFLQGFAKPVADLSRGASEQDIVSTVILTLAKLL